MVNKMQQIKAKGFAMQNIDNSDETYAPIDFSKIKVGIKTLADATFEIGNLQKANKNLSNKDVILKAIQSNDIISSIEISEYFFKVSGIYQRICEYFATLYKYDWMITPIINREGNKKIDNKKILDSYQKALKWIDDFGVKKFCSEVALKVIKNGSYYGYIVDNNQRPSIQELPVKYCRSRFYTLDRRPVIEFNMKYFDDNFSDAEQRMKILKLFPLEIKKGYEAYKKGRLKPDFQGDDVGWYLLDTEKTIRFTFNDNCLPAFISIIPSIVDLDGARGIDKKKMEQQLLKIIIQRMPIDKNGDLIFDVDEAKTLHNNAVRMLGKAVGVDVLTTFAETKVEDMQGSAASDNQQEGMERARQSVFDDAGVTQMLFNADGNLAVDKSAAKDAAALSNLIYQFESFFNILLQPFNKNPKKMSFKLEILDTTIFNFRDLSKDFKDQSLVGGSKILPLVALGVSQLDVLNNAYFENSILNVKEVFDLEEEEKTQTTTQKQSNNSGGAGRPSLPDDQKSEKTIRNIEAQS